MHALLVLTFNFTAMISSFILCISLIIYSISWTNIIAFDDTQAIQTSSCRESIFYKSYQLKYKSNLHQNLYLLDTPSQQFNGYNQFPSYLSMHKINCSNIYQASIPDNQQMNLNDILTNITYPYDILYDYDQIDIPSNIPMVLEIAIKDVLNITNIDLAIDKFIIQQPWWKMSYDSGLNHDNSNFMVILERYPISWMKFFQFLIKTQYLTIEKCQAKAMTFFRKDLFHPGFSSSFLFQSKHIIPNNIFITYYPRKTSFIDINDCKEVQNKYECAFLPMTNCSLPKIITECSTDTCLDVNTNDLFFNLIILNNTIIKSLDEMRKYAAIADFTNHPFGLVNSLNTSLAFKYIQPFSQELKSNFNALELHPFTSMFHLLFTFRPNYFYRKKIRHLVHRLRGKSKMLDNTNHKIAALRSHTPCIAAHIRRGDRIAYKKNITNLCFNISHDRDYPKEEAYGCLDETNQRLMDCKIYRTSYEDLGCNSKTPFGLITLQDVVNKVPLLVHPVIHNLLVFTDDPMWLQDEIIELKKIEPKWNIYTLQEPKYNHSTNTEVNITNYQSIISFIRRDAGTRSGVFLHTSIELVRQCSAFIGHFHSGISKHVFYPSMCIEHAGMKGICPPMYDFEWGLNLNFPIS